MLGEKVLLKNKEPDCEYVVHIQNIGHIQGIVHVHTVYTFRTLAALTKSFLVIHFSCIITICLLCSKYIKLHSNYASCIIAIVVGLLRETKEKIFLYFLLGYINRNKIFECVVD